MDSEDGWVPLGAVGTQLANLVSDFDPRTTADPLQAVGAEEDGLMLCGMRLVDSQAHPGERHTI